MVCLHPVDASSRTFSAILPELADVRSVYAPDLPGYGESDSSPGRSIADAAIAISDLANDLRLRQIDLLGVQYGAEVALELAAARPALVRRLVLAGVPSAERLSLAKQQRLLVNVAACGDDQFDAVPPALTAQISAFLQPAPNPCEAALAWNAIAVRLNKYISETGVCSRREADRWIEAGRVTCNGQVAALGTRVVDGDEICVDGEPIGAKRRQVYIALNKPVGVTCTTEAHIEDNIIDLVGYPERIFPIGRLDKDSEGLILLTNNGDIVNEILRSENDHEKEYIVTVDRPITDLSLKMMASGVKIMGELTKPCRVSRIERESFRMILTQGLNRQIRRMCSALGYKAQRLRRVRIMNIHLGTLGAGKWRHLTDHELAGLLPRCENASPAPSPTAAPPRRGLPTIAVRS